MAYKKLTTRVQNKRDLEVNWNNATGFIPLAGELIIYSKEVDDTGKTLTLPSGRERPYTYDRFKLGDGKTKVKDLPFAILPQENGKVVIGDGEAIGVGTIAGGTTDKSLVADLAGDLAASITSLTPAKASGALSISYGANSESIAPGSASIGVINTAGVKGYYWDSLTFDTTNKKITIQLSTTRRGSSLVKPSYPASVSWAVGDILCIKNGGWYNGYFVISTISGNTVTATLAPDITTSTLPFTKVNYTSTIIGTSYDQPDDRTVYALQPKQTSDKLKAPYVPRTGVVSIGFGAMALGGKNTSTGMLGIVKGRANLNTGTYSDVSGNDNTVHANSSNVSGRTNTVYGREQLVSGNGNIVDGFNNTVSGMKNIIGSSNNNIVTGQENTVGSYVADSYVNGYQSKMEASAIISFIHGLGCKTQKYLTTAFGAFTKATKFGQFAIGRGNNPDEKSGNNKDAIFMVGGVAPASASDISEPTTQKNAFSVFWDGTARVGADPIAEKDVATKGYVDNKTKDLATKTELSNYATTKNLVTKTYVDSTFTTKKEISELGTFLDDFIILQENFLGLLDSGVIGDYTWILDADGTLTISGTGNMVASTPWPKSKVAKVILESSITNVIASAFSPCSSLTNIIADEKNKNYSSLDGVLFNKNKTALVCYPAGKTNTSITIPNSITRIGDNAFRECTSLTSITLPDNITSIGGGAFYHTGYFNESSNWENEVLYIGNHLIRAKTLLSGSYEIKSGTVTLADESFWDCDSLTSITIPKSVTNIGNRAFRECSKLTTVYYRGSEAEMAEISIGDEANEALTNVTWICNYEG